MLIPWIYSYKLIAFSLSSSPEKELLPLPILLVVEYAVGMSYSEYGSITFRRESMKVVNGLMVIAGRWFPYSSVSG